MQVFTVTANGKTELLLSATIEMEKVRVSQPLRTHIHLIHASRSATTTWLHKNSQIFCDVILTNLLVGRVAPQKFDIRAHHPK